MIGYSVVLVLSQTHQAVTWFPFHLLEYDYKVELGVSHNKISHFAVFISGPPGCYLVTPSPLYENNYKIELGVSHNNHFSVIISDPPACFLVILSPLYEYNYKIELGVSHNKISHFAVIISGPSGCYLVTHSHLYEYDYKIEPEVHVIIQQCLSANTNHSISMIDVLFDQIARNSIK